MAKRISRKSDNKLSTVTEMISKESADVHEEKGNSQPSADMFDSEKRNEQIEGLRDQREQLLRQAREHIVALTGKGQPIIVEALEDFLSFFQDYTEYFFDESKEEFFSKQKKLTYTRLLSTVLENTRQVWGMLSLAINQRFNPVYVDRLTKIDALGKELLEKSGLLVKTSPIIYFDKIYHITRYPYQVHPLLSIPLDRFNGDDQSAIAHEIGHHIFWNEGELDEYAERMDLLRDGVSKIIFKSDEFPLDRLDLDGSEKSVKVAFEKFHIWMGWREEAFADVFGTLLGGPQYAKTAQDILVRERLSERSSLIQRDDEHPMPALRPFLASTTLRIIAREVKGRLGKDLEKFVDKLEERWRPFWDASEELEREHHNSQNSTLVSALELREVLEEMVEMILHKELFIAENGDNEKRTSLLDRVSYWGKEGSQQQIEELQTISQHLGPLTIPALSVPELAMAPYPLPDVSDRPFVKLLQFVSAQRLKRARRGKELNTEEWQDILFLNLTLGRDHTECQVHAHYWSFAHYHTGYGTFLC